jgi:hypothetical protein
MSVDVSTKTLAELENFERNHRQAGKTDTPFFHALLREMEVRRRGLDLEKSLACVIAAAAQRHFVSYKELAEASGLSWAKAHRVINGHLGKLCEYSYRKEGLLLSAVVVNSSNVKSGDMEAATLTGFTNKAKDFVDVMQGTEKEFLRAEQQKVFARYAGSNAA